MLTFWLFEQFYLMFAWLQVCLTYKLVSARALIQSAVIEVVSQTFLAKSKRKNFVLKHVAIIRPGLDTVCSNRGSFSNFSCKV